MPISRILKEFEDTYFIVYDEAGLAMGVTKDLELIGHLQDNCPQAIDHHELSEMDMDDFNRYIADLNRSKDEIQS